MPNRGKKKADLAVAEFDDSGSDRRGGLFLWADTASKKVMEVLSAHLNAQQQEMLDLLAQEAYAFAETAYSQLKGHEKLKQALDYLEAQARLKGIPFDAAQAKIAIEKAWLEIEGMPKRLQQR